MRYYKNNQKVGTSIIKYDGITHCLFFLIKFDLKENKIILLTQLFYLQFVTTFLFNFVLHKQNYFHTNFHKRKKFCYNISDCIYTREKIKQSLNKIDQTQFNTYKITHDYLIQFLCVKLEVHCRHIQQLQFL